jgi:hypothetical protein
MKRTISGVQVAAAGGGEPSGGALPEAARRPLRELMDDRLLDALLERSRDQAGGLRLTGEGSMLGELVRAALERALESELTAHLGYDRGERGGAGGNARNGAIAKTVQTGVGPVALQVPRDRAGSFEPVLVPKRSGRVAGGLDDMVISLYAHGLAGSRAGCEYEPDPGIRGPAIALVDRQDMPEGRRAEHDSGLFEGLAGGGLADALAVLKVP